MLALLALALQTPTLDANDARAAETCVHVVTVVGANSYSLFELAAQRLHLKMHIAKTSGGGISFTSRMTELTRGPDGGATVSIETAQALAPLCDSRFPRTRSKAAARLPAQPWRRDLLCFTTLAILQGAAKAAPETLARIKAVLDPLSARMSDAEFRKRGISDEKAVMSAFGDELLASLDTGNPLTIATACGVKGL